MNSLLQEIFTKSYLGLKSQGFTRSLGVLPKTQETVCVFHDKSCEGTIRHCAIGWLDIDEELSEFTLIQDTPKKISWIKNRLNDELPNKVAVLLNRLQEAHDQGNTPRLMEIRLNTIAKNYGFDIPSL